MKVSKFIRRDAVDVTVPFYLFRFFPDTADIEKFKLELMDNGSSPTHVGTCGNLFLAHWCSIGRSLTCALIVPSFVYSRPSSMMKEILSMPLPIIRKYILLYAADYSTPEEVTDGPQLSFCRRIASCFFRRTRRTPRKIVDCIVLRRPKTGEDTTFYLRLLIRLAWNAYNTAFCFLLWFYRA